ncbi:hypothetical protein [Trichormus sp. NMC-1]|nr:hypothetical protein [Trichormus sp. NMC-1]
MDVAKVTTTFSEISAKIDVNTVKIGFFALGEYCEQLIDELVS